MSVVSLASRFATRLREIRESRRLSQERLADAAGLHRTHISLIERGRRSVRLETIERLAKALQVEPADLMPTGAPHREASLGPRPSRYDLTTLNLLLPHVRRYQALASAHGIGDIFQDNGGTLLQTLLILNLRNMGTREGYDAVDDEGNEYELKTVNARLTGSFSTHHHINPTILAKYRGVKAWYFSIYDGIELQEIYRLDPLRLESHFTKWESKWKDGGKDLNNPKIPISFVRRHGQRVFPEAETSDTAVSNRRSPRPC
jgi:transcriptional regulator with XRE-family HTH domain